MAPPPWSPTCPPGLVRPTPPRCYPSRAIIVDFRRYTLLSLDDCLYTLDATICSSHALPCTGLGFLGNVTN